MRIGSTVVALLLALRSAVGAAPADAPRVVLSTSLGDVTVALDPEAAPITVANFLRYVRAGFYDGTIVHRVVRNFMLQAGGLDADMREKPALAPPILSEAGTGRSNRAGTVAMARRSAADSATSQFFVNLHDNAFLDRDHALDGVGYAVFGEVVAGMEVVRKIETVDVIARRGHPDVPVTPIVIRSVRELPPDAALSDTSAPPRTPPAAVAGTAD